MNRKKILIAGGAGLVIIVLGLLWQQGFLGGDRRLYRSIKENSELVSLFNAAKSKEAEISKDSEKPVPYLDAALDWKSIGERVVDNKNDFFAKSLAVYERGIEKFGQGNVLFYLNAGHVAESMGNYDKAGSYYMKAIEISPADESGYLDLVNLYYYKLHKSKEEILPIFDAGLSKMAFTTPLISGRATYLRRIGAYAEALKDFQVLSRAFPGNLGYKEIIQELQNNIRQASGK
ncbi:MAG: hypothetical protein A2754_00360 [Candidatus Magasanikbacteria bacterium RIFCSPHIGHO2_01_FULL_47_8]|uniref:Uncharacterized protein n=1 Tax=Candidatus Magasanikbacteria bacterium RIFCSPHIGHO2_01_FULL_47_8 TaxID=1798673 RepID=A0A1F6MBQ5_9BACT|nr:MAG: hypothetical protein A2754_00360 [Candidatus Magasanikbacteria bacterium RIFCSPHIGHO2_01_FULL_47_8]